MSDDDTMPSLKKHRQSGDNQHRADNVPDDPSDVPPNNLVDLFVEDSEGQPLSHNNLTAADSNTVEPVHATEITDYTTVCRYFLLGTCAYGESCRFRHQVSPTKVSRSNVSHPQRPRTTTDNHEFDSSSISNISQPEYAARRMESAHPTVPSPKPACRYVMISLIIHPQLDFMALCAGAKQVTHVHFSILTPLARSPSQGCGVPRVRAYSANILLLRSLRKPASMHSRGRTIVSRIHNCS